MLEYSIPLAKQYAILAKKYSAIDFTPLRNMADPNYDRYEGPEVSLQG